MAKSVECTFGKWVVHLRPSDIKWRSRKQDLGSRFLRILVFLWDESRALKLFHGVMPASLYLAASSKRAGCTITYYTHGGEGRL